MYGKLMDWKPDFILHSGAKNCAISCFAITLSNLFTLKELLAHIYSNKLWTKWHRFINLPRSTFAICRRPSVCNVCAPLLRRLKFSAMFLYRLVRWPSVDIQVKFYTDRPRGTPLSGKLNTRGVVEYSDFGPIERYISETVQDRGYVCINH